MAQGEVILFFPHFFIVKVALNLITLIRKGKKLRSRQSDVPRRAGRQKGPPQARQSLSMPQTRRQSSNYDSMLQLSSKNRKKALNSNPFFALVLSWSVFSPP